MNLFVITILALWSYPLLAAVVLTYTKRSLKLQKNIVSIFIGFSTIILLAILTGISTVFDNLNYFFATTFYFTISLALLFAYSFKNPLIKIISGLLMFLLFLVGYLSSTIGILGVGLILNNYQVSRIIPLNKTLIYKQYNLGSAPSDYRGIKISLVERCDLLPWFEREIFIKKYEELIYDKNLKSMVGTTNSKPVLYSHNFKVSYLPSAKKLVLLDSIRPDTICLK